MDTDLLDDDEFFAKGEADEFYRRLLRHYDEPLSAITIGSTPKETAVQTNLNTDGVDALREAGLALLDAAYAFWKVHRKHAGRCAVVWLKDTDGKLVVFTRGEYVDQIMRNIQPLVDAIPLGEEE